MKIFQINTVANSGSTGRITEGIGQEIIKKGWQSYIAYGRTANPSTSILIKIGNTIDHYIHALITRLTDRHGEGSVYATKKLISKIKKINPDIIHLHNVHGYYLNIRILFNYLKEANKPIVWTLHDCWSFTGHCSHYEFVDCQKWQSLCCDCPQKIEYPKSFFDNSEKNYLLKKRLFSSINNLNLVPVSFWLKIQLGQSFLKNYPAHVINNGIDLNVFQHTNGDLKEKLGLNNKFVILGVASTWDEKKGINDFIELSKILNDNFKIILIGLSKKQIATIPNNIIAKLRTENAKELAEFYSIADVFFNPTLQDTFPTTNLEAQACGTPVITYKSGGSPETITNNTGIVIAKQDINSVVNEINKMYQNKDKFSKNCLRKNTENNYDKNIKFKEYIALYERLVNI